MNSPRRVRARLAGVLLCAALAGCGVSSQDEPQRIEQPPPPRNTPSVDIDQPTTTLPPITSTTTTTPTSTTAPIEDDQDIDEDGVSGPLDFIDAGEPGVASMSLPVPVD